MGKIDKLKTSPFRKVLKSCNDKSQQVQEIEKLNISDEIVKPDVHPRDHYFNETQYSPEKSTLRKREYCPCGVDTGGQGLPGQREVHISNRDVSVFTFYCLREIIEHRDQVNYLREKNF